MRHIFALRTEGDSILTLGSLRVLLCLALGITGTLPVFCQGSYHYPDTYTELKQFVQNDLQVYVKRMPGVSFDYRLGPGDVLFIEVVGVPKLDQSAIVQNSGQISIPLLGSIMASGLTAEELETEIASKLKELNLVTEPEALVYITEYHAKRIFVIGEIDTPGQFVMTQPWSLMDAILIAGGLDITAGRYGYLHRRIAESSPAPLNPDVSRPEVALPGTVVTAFDLQPLKDGGVLDDNPVLQDGDVFIVARQDIETYYVVGGVRRPGGFEIPAGASITVSKAISWAGGPTKLAKLKAGILVRDGPGGDKIRVAVDFSAILRGDQPDADVLPNDVLFIPDSKLKTLGQGMINALPNIIYRGAFF